MQLAGAKDGFIAMIPTRETVEAGIKRAGEAIQNQGTKILDGTQLALDLVGLIPVVGEPADAVNAAIYFGSCDYTNATLSTASMVPVVGWLGTAGKFANKGVKAVKATEFRRQLGIRDHCGKND